MRINYFFLSLFFFSAGQLTSQNIEEEYAAQYQENIKLEYINEVYIPIDVNDAIQRIDALSNEEGRQKMIEAPEEIVSERLVLGLGKWMIVNWNFYDGSRLSHHLKQYGVTLPDDMAKFLIVTYYRYLKGTSLELEERGEAIYQQRLKEQEIRNQEKTIISEQTQIIKQN